MEELKKPFQPQQPGRTDGKNEDVVYSAEMADEDDLEAVERAGLADARQEQSP